MTRRKSKEGPSTNTIAGPMEKAKTLMFTPISVNGVKFSRCLVDTGSEVNLIPTRAVTANGFSYSPGEISAIKGFDGHEGQIIGGLLAQVQLGPMTEPKQIRFWVSPDVQYPIIGLPTLKECGMLVDCTSHCLVERTSGLSVSCSAVIMPHKGKKEKN